MESSNGFYYDSATKMYTAFVSKKWKEMGVYLAKAFSLLKFDQHMKIKRSMVQKIAKDDYQKDIISDD